MDGSLVTNAVSNLEEKRNNLKQIVVDPLPEIIAKASTAQIPTMTTNHSATATSVDVGVQGVGSDDVDGFYSAEESIQPTKKGSTPLRPIQNNLFIHDDIEEDSSSDEGINNRKGLKTPSIYQKKKSARQERFESSQSQDVDSFLDSPGDISMSHKKVSKHRNKSHGSYSDEQLDAVKQGVKEFGKGKWVMIRDAYPCLKGRSSVSIKVS